MNFTLFKVNRFNAFVYILKDVKPWLQMTHCKHIHHSFPKVNLYLGAVTTFPLCSRP